ncbi:ABC transporter ATP-binding protein [Aminipila luticellarii]|uniref:ABC transporter ATP-binding protein n=1 Tax=Aminipila luticellarii TaxID=2507160 RepID=A0A410PWL6_9FIRM|nr:ABC transporter ATP-binding protein [Aminipila luticellarii]QAT43338.1 ABC transporter ATP-binding protein [Aminipila luticellarii]
MIMLKDIRKEYKINAKNKKKVFENFNLEISRGDFVAVVGKSGVGKSTLLNILSGLDTPTSGEYYFDGEKVPKTNLALAEFRRKNIGMIVQNFALIEEWNVFENIALPLKYRKVPKREIEKQVQEIAGKLGIQELLRKYPQTLSGGENQRVAIARAVIVKPSILIADEPTASLDSENKMNVFEILENLNEEGISIILATHDKEIYEKCKRTIPLAELQHA